MTFEGLLKICDLNIVLNYEWSDDETSLFELYFYVIILKVVFLSELCYVMMILYCLYDVENTLRVVDY